MKRLIPLLLSVLLLTGCVRYQAMREPVTFYYVRKNYPSEMRSVLDSEEWEAAGHREDLHYLLALYFMGPSGKDLVSPLPEDTKIVSLEQSENCIALTLTRMNLPESDFTLACACLAQTLLGITSADQITISDSENTVTMGHDALSLFDTIIPTEEHP